MNTDQSKKTKRRNLFRTLLSMATLGVPVGAVAVFKHKGRPVFVFPKPGETAKQAIERTTQAYGKAPSDAKKLLKRKG